MLKAFHVWMLFLGTLQLTTAEPRDTTPPKQSIRFPEQAQKTPDLQERKQPFLFGCCSVVVAAEPSAQDESPPVVTQVPRPKIAPWTEIKTGVGQLTLLTAGTRPATWALVDDVDADLHATKDAAVVTFAASKPGKYRIVAFVDGAEPMRVVMIVSGTGPIVTPDPVIPDPGPVVPDPNSKLYFLIVRQDGPALPSFTVIMGDPAWATLTKAGHQYKDKTATEAASLGVKIPAGASLPVVVILQISDDGKKSAIVKGPVPLPITSEAILKLAEIK